MSEPSRRLKVGAFTLIEVLVVLFIVFLLAAMFFPAMSGRGPSSGVPCRSNQRQIGLGLILFQTDHDSRFPWQTPATNGGTMDFISIGQASPHYQVLSAFLGNRTDRLLCPVDKARRKAEDYSQLRDQNISYFVNLDASTNQPVQTILVGDRYLMADGRAVTPGLFVLTPNREMTWAPGFHRQGGTLAFADGHAEFVRDNHLSSVTRNQALATNRLSGRWLHQQAA